MGEPIDPNPQPPYVPNAPWSPPDARGGPGPYPPPGAYGPPGGGMYPVPGAAPYATSWPPIPPQPNRRRQLAAIIVGLAVLVAAGVSTAIALKPSHHVDRLTAPASFANYRRLDGAASTQVAQSLRAAGAAIPQAKAFYDAAAIAAYATNVSDQPTLILIVVNASAVTGLGMTDPQSTVDGLLVASTSDSQRYPPGPHGGAMNCGTAQFGTASETMCAWSDARTVGLLVSARPALPEAQAAQVTLAARDAVD